NLHTCCNAVRVAPRIGDGYEVDAFYFSEDTSVVPPHHADAQKTGPQVGHQRPASAKELTAETILSRSAAVSDGCTGSESTSRAARSVSGSSRSGANCFNDGRR